MKLRSFTSIIIVFVLTQAHITSAQCCEYVPMSKYHREYVAKAEFDSPMPLLPPPITTLVMNVTGPGILQEVRFSAYRSMGFFGTFISIEIDGLTHIFPLAWGHENQKDFGRIYNEGTYYKLPILDGLKFTASCAIRVYGYAVMPGGQSGGGYVTDILVLWTTQ